MSNAQTEARDMHTRHYFDGDNATLGVTADARLDVRNALFSLAQALQKSQNAPVRIKADIQLNVGGATPKQNIYTVVVTDGAFDADHFDRVVPLRQADASNGAPMTGASLSTPIEVDENGSLSAIARSLSASGSRRPQDGDDGLELRPFKKARLSGMPPASNPVRVKDGDTPFKATSSPAPLGGDDALLTYIKSWHREWTQQGGWLFDNISKSNEAADKNSQTLENKMDLVQDVLGQALNAASASSTLQLDNIAKLAPWLEHCRKTSADTVQAREEKWRTSSATFHDQTRREREAAEKRMERMLAEQRELLAKIARVNGIDPDAVDTIEVLDDSSPNGERESSLGAQLRRELNTEATKSTQSGSSIRAAPV